MPFEHPPERRQHGIAQCAGEAADPHQPLRLLLRGELGLGRGHGGEDAPAVFGEPASGRRQPHSAARGFQQGDARLPLQRGELLTHGGGTVAGRARDRGHRAEPIQLDERAQFVGVHAAIIRRS